MRRRYRVPKAKGRIFRGGPSALRTVDFFKKRAGLLKFKDMSITRKKEPSSYGFEEKKSAENFGVFPVKNAAKLIRKARDMVEQEAG